MPDNLKALGLLFLVAIVGCYVWIGSVSRDNRDAGVTEKAELKRGESASKEKAAQQAYDNVLKSELEKNPSDALAAKTKAELAKKTILGNS